MFADCLVRKGEFVAPGDSPHLSPPVPPPLPGSGLLGGCDSGAAGGSDARGEGCRRGMRWVRGERAGEKGRVRGRGTAEVGRQGEGPGLGRGRGVCFGGGVGSRKKYDMQITCK